MNKFTDEEKKNVARQMANFCDDYMYKFSDFYENATGDILNRDLFNEMCLNINEEDK